jgi:large subunit ribosomal protein L27e
MGKKKAEKRSKVKPFIKIVNFSHLMPTRYFLSLLFTGSLVTLSYIDCLLFVFCS